jgi:hypothetical protein
MWNARQWEQSFEIEILVVIPNSDYYVSFGDMYEAHSV